MGHAEATRIIHAPPDAVWQALNDIDHTPEWVVGLERAEMVSPAPYGINSSYYDYNRLGPIPQKTLWRVTAFEPMTRQVHVSESSTIPSTLTFELTPVPEGTQAHMQIDYQFLPRLGPVGGLLETVLMDRLIQRVIEKNLSNLEEYLQQKQAIPSG